MWPKKYLHQRRATEGAPCKMRFQVWHFVCMVGPCCIFSQIALLTYLASGLLRKGLALYKVIKRLPAPTLLGVASVERILRKQVTKLCICPFLRPSSAAILKALPVLNSGIDDTRSSKRKCSFAMYLEEESILFFFSLARWSAWSALFPLLFNATWRYVTSPSTNGMPTPHDNNDYFL